MHKTPKVNYHIHTSFSGDNVVLKRFSETPERHIQKAIKSGFDEICFTDHLVVGYPRTQHIYSHSMDIRKMHEYVQEIVSLAKKYEKKIKVKLGIEIDWLPEKANEIRKIIREHPFDCVLGSVHLLNNREVESCNDRERKETWEKMSQKDIYKFYVAYYRAIQEMAKAKIYDVIAHIDLIKRDAYVPKRSVLPIIKKTLDVVAKNNLCIEVNTSGLRKQIKEMHPSLEILKLCRQKGIPITIGTDAHKVSRLNFRLKDGMKLIKNAGYKEIATFEKRKRIIIKI